MANVDVWNWDGRTSATSNNKHDVHSVVLADGQVTVHFETRKGLIDFRNTITRALEDGAKNDLV